MKRKSNTIIINKFIVVCIALSFLIAIIKLCAVAFKQNIDGLNLTEFANSRNTEKINLLARRGTIFDVNGDELAQSVNSYTLFAYLSESRTKDPDYPCHVVNKEYTAKQLAPLLGYSEEYILNLLNSEGLYQVNLKGGITTILKEQIEALDLPGLDFVETTKRWYPMGNFASYVVGYATKDDDGKTTGKLGIESYFNEELTGTDGYMEYQKDPYGYRMPQHEPIIVESEAGNDIYLTIDNEIQMFLEKGIKELSSKYDMTWLTFTIMDANTGAIVATSSVPSFDPNERNIDSYLTPLTALSYEPGSTMKIFSFMSAIENGIYDGDKLYQSGTIPVDNAIIKDFNGVGWGMISYDQGFANSSNVAATHLALSLGRDNLRKTYEDLGFGALTGIELPGEVAGDISFYYRTELATASFGQGITTTPIQTLQALTSITNEGSIIKPYIVDKVVNSKGEIVYQGGRQEVKKVVSKETADKVKDLMYKAVYEGKTNAGNFKADNVTVVGKTGTAQIPSSSGGYLTGNYDYINSFAGIFPYEEPKYIFYVSTKQLVGSFNEVAKISKKMVEEIAKYKNIADAVEELDNSKIIILDNLISTNVRETEEKLKKSGLNPIIIGDGKYVINQYPLKNNKVQYGTKVFLKTNGTKYIMPDTKGWSSSDIITFCNIIGLKYKLNDYGHVVSTSIEPGAEIDLETTLEINLSKEI
ncbi:MAG: penicillin-binding protein [Bacilli bacterium]